MSAVLEKKPTKAKKPKAVGVIERLITEQPEPSLHSLRVPLASLVRHPDNRQPTPAAVEAVAQSLEREGQLERLLVREIRGADEFCSSTTYQIISGETRWHAARSLGWESIDVEVRALDDAAALRVLAAANAARQDLDPIAKARLIVRLCDPVERGGSGMSREEAAKMFDLQSGGAASNLVRLLELPATWLDRVASGELAQSYARELLPLLALGAESPAWGELEKSWAIYQKDHEVWDGECWQSREALANEVADVLVDLSRPVDKADPKKRSYYEETGSYENHSIRFKLTPSLEEELRIVELPTGLNGAMIRRATNCKLYDAFQVPAIKAWMAKKSKRQQATDADEGEHKFGKTAATTAAEEAARREKAAEVLAKRIELWRAAWLRELVAEAIVDERWADLCVRLLVWQQQRITQISFRERDALHLDEQIKAIYGRDILRAKGMGDVSSVIVQWLRLDPRDGYSHPMPDEFVEDIIDLMGLDLADRWDVMQSSGTRPARMQEFFELHSSEQLDALGTELAVGTTGAAKKAGKVGAFMNAPKTLKLPKSLRSLRKRGAK